MAGYYCFGGVHGASLCIGEEGMYCPENFKPGASSVREGVQGRRCPPWMYCQGEAAAPVRTPP
eukprot:3206909-Rhodomonas_salina.1